MFHPMPFRCFVPHVTPLSLPPPTHTHTHTLQVLPGRVSFGVSLHPVDVHLIRLCVLYNATPLSPPHTVTHHAHHPRWSPRHCPHDTHRHGGWGGRGAILCRCCRRCCCCRCCCFGLFAGRLVLCRTDNTTAQHHMASHTAQHSTPAVVRQDSDSLIHVSGGGGGDPPVHSSSLLRSIIVCRRVRSIKLVTLFSQDLRQGRVCVCMQRRGRATCNHTMRCNRC